MRVGLAPYTVRVGHRVGHVAPHPSGPVRGLFAWIQQDQQPVALKFVEAPPSFLIVGWLRIVVGVLQARAHRALWYLPSWRASSTRSVVRQILERPLA